MGKALIVVAVILVAAVVVIIVVTLMYRLTSGQAVRRRELRRVNQELTYVRKALDDVTDAANNWREIDSPLASEVKQIIRELNEKERKLREANS